MQVETDILKGQHTMVDIQMAITHYPPFQVTVPLASPRLPADICHRRRANQKAVPALPLPNQAYELYSNIPMNG